MITRPTGLNVMDWASQLVLDLDSYGAWGRLTSPEVWQDWAAQFLNNSVLARSLPNPYTFDTWQDWAERLCATLA